MQHLLQHMNYTDLAIGDDCSSQSDPESSNFQSLRFIFNSRPADLRTKEVIAALCNLLHTRAEKRHRPQESTYNKPIPVQGLASSLLVSCLCGLRAWPLALIKLYITDALGARQWVQHANCVELVQNIKTVWNVIPNIEHEDKGECQEELEQKQKQKQQYDGIAGIPLAQTVQEQQPPPLRGFMKEDSNSGSESSSEDEMEVDIGGGVALSGHEAIPAPPHVALVLGTPLEVDTSAQNTIQHPHITPRVANRFVQLRTKAMDMILDAIKARLVGLNTGGRDRESSGGGVVTSTVWQVVLALTEVAPISQARVIAASHLDKWLQSPALSRDALSLKSAIIMALERHPGSAEEDIAVVRSVSCLHVKVSQLDTHVEHIASMSIMCPEFLREVIMGVLLGVEGTRKDAGNDTTAVESRFQTKAIQAIQRAVGTDELLIFLGRICRDLSEEYVVAAAASANATDDVGCQNNIALKCLSLGLSTIRQAGDQSIHPIPLLRGLFYNSNRRAQIQGSLSVATMGFLIAGMVRRVIMAHAEAEVLHVSSKVSSSSMKVTEKHSSSSSHHFHHQQQQQQSQQQQHRETTISVPPKFISSLLPVIDCCSLWCSGDLRRLGASANDCLAILQYMLFLLPSAEYKGGGGAIGDVVQHAINPTQGSTSMGMANPAQHADEHQNDIARILCERFSPITSASLSAVLSLSEGLSPPPFEFALSVIHKMVIRAAESSAWLKTPLAYLDMHSLPQQQQEEMLQQVHPQSHKQSIPQQTKLRRKGSISSEVVVLEVQPSSPLGGKDDVPKDGFVQVDNPDLIKGIFRLSQWSYPPPSSLKTMPPYDIRSPVSCLEPGCNSTFTTWTLYQNHMSQSHGYPKLLNFAIRKLYWKCCIICVVLAAGKPQTIGNYMWNNDPTLRCLMQILVCNRFEPPPLCEVTATSAYPCMHQQQERSQSLSSLREEDRDSHVLREDITVSMERITREWERREIQFTLDSAYPPPLPLTPRPPTAPSPKPLPTKQQRLQEKVKSTTTRKAITTPLVENVSQRGRKRKSLFNLVGLMDDDEFSELETAAAVEGGHHSQQQQKGKKENKQMKKNKSEIVCPEENPEDIEVRKFGLRISDVMLPESCGTRLGLPRFPSVEVLQMLRTLDGELGLGARLRQSTQPDFITAVVENIIPATADSIERISSWLVSCMATEPNIISRVPAPIVTHLALMACLEEKQQQEQTMRKRVVLYEEGFNVPIGGEPSKSSIFLDDLRHVATPLAQHVSSFVWDAYHTDVAAEAATVLLEAIGDVSAYRRCAAHNLLNLACFSSSSGTGAGACEVSESLTTTSEGGETQRCWLTQLSKLPCFSVIQTVTASAFERALIHETDTAVLCGIIEAFGNGGLGLISHDRFCAPLWQFLERGQVAEKVLLQHPSTLDISSRVIRDSLINSYCIHLETDLNVPDESCPVGNGAWKRHPLGRVFIRFPSSYCVKIMERGGTVAGGVEKKRKRKEMEEPVLPSVPLALLKVSIRLISMWQPHVEIPAIEDLFLMLLPNLEEDRTANIGIAGVSSCAGIGDQENGEGSSFIQLRDWIILARTRRREVGRLTALCVPEPLLPQLLLGSGLGTGCILAALARLGELGTHRLNALFREPKVVYHLLLRIRAYLLKIRQEEHKDEEVSSLISAQKTKELLIFLESKADCPRNNQDKPVLRRKIVSLQLPAATSLPFLPVFGDVTDATGGKVAESNSPLGWDDVLWKKLFVRNPLVFDDQTSSDDECLGTLQSLISDSCKGSPAQACRSLLCLRRLVLSAAASTISAPRNCNTGFSSAENALRSAFLAVRHELEETEDRGAVTDILGEFLAGGLTFVEDLLYLSEKSKAESIPLMLLCNFSHWALCEDWVKSFLIRYQTSLKPERIELSLAALERIVMTSTNGTLNGRGESSKAMKWIRGVGSYLERKIHLSEAEITAVGYIVLNCAQFGHEEAFKAKKALLAYCTGVTGAVAVLARLFLTAAAIDDNNNVNEQEVHDNCKQEDRSRMVYARQLLLALYMKQPDEFVALFKEPQPGLWNLLMKEFASYEDDLMESSCAFPGRCRILSSASALSTVSGDGAAAGSSSLSNALEDQQQSDGSATFHTRLMCSIAKQYPLQALSKLKGVTRIIMDDTSFVKSNRASCPNMRPAIASGALGGSTTPFTKVHVRIWGSTYSDKLWVAVLNMLACCSRDAITAAIANPRVFKDLLELIQVYLMLLSVQLEFGNAEETTACSLARGISEILQWIGQDGEVESLQVLGWSSANELLHEFVQDSSMAVVTSG